MNADRLLADYKRIADAPDAIPRLRRFVLDLAVRGKLVPQDPNDEPASELLKRIAGEKARLVKAGEIRREKPVRQIEHSEIPYDTPDGWKWVRLATATIIVQGFPFSSTNFSTDAELGRPLIRIGDIGSNAPEVFIKGQYDPAYLVNRGDILLGLSGSIKCAVWEGPAALLNQRIARIAPASGEIHSIWLLFGVGACIDKWKDETSKLTVQNIKAAQLYDALLPVPPLAEQRRIVAKVDEFMALCDQLEAARAEREAVRDRLTAASLARLNAPDPDTFQDDARFALNTLPALSTRPDQIKQLRQTILSLAVIGKLTDNRADSPTAVAELKTIEAKKRELALKKPKAIAAISLEEQWCALPERWEWARWDQITDWITYGFTRPMPHEKDGIPIVTGKNVNCGEIKFETAHRTPVEAYRKLNDKRPPQAWRHLGHKRWFDRADCYRGQRRAILYQSECCCALAPFLSFQ
jgi:type I restriction enzyme S subunit